MSDIVYRNKRFRSSTEEVLNIIEQDDAGLEKGLPGIAIKSAHILLRATKQRDGQIVSQLADFLTNSSFVMIIFKRYNKILANGENVTMSITGKLKRDDKFHKVFGRGNNAKNDDCGQLYVKHVLKVLRKRAAFCENNNIFLVISEKRSVKLCFSNYDHGVYSNMLQRSEKRCARIS